MTDRPPLAVFLFDHHVADVVDAGFGDTAIRYTAEALANPVGSRLSLSLPVQDAVHPFAGPGGRWVRSLLPEGRALAWAVQHFGIPEDDRYGLIAVLGADVAGAVRILTEPSDPTDDGSYERLSAEELAEVVHRVPEVGLGLDRERGVKLSLAGMQDKVLLHRIDDGYALPIDGAPSTLIVKPEPGVLNNGVDVTGLASNELFCLALARTIGLHVASATMETFGGTPCLVVERFDRELIGGRIRRRHQEDLLAAMGLDPLLKYERPEYERRAPVGAFTMGSTTIARPGPSLRDIAACLERHIGRARLIQFLEAVTFNVAIGNADSHARNYSVLLSSDGSVELAPLYDIISTCCYEGLDREFAQRVNGIDSLDEIRGSDLVGEATSWGIPARLAEHRVRDVITRIGEQLSHARSEAEAMGGDPKVVAATTAVVGARVRMLAG